jgi:hypothetical protein
MVLSNVDHDMDFGNITGNLLHKKADIVTVTAQIM